MKTDILKKSKPLILILIFVCTMIGCGGYNSYVLTIKNTKITFEVPQSYELTPDTIIENGIIERGIGLSLGIPFDPDRLYYDPELSIIAFDSYADVTFYLDDLLNNLSSSTSGKKIELLDRSSTIVSGMDAEQIIISVTSLVPDPDPKYPAICRRAYFNYNQQIWIIDLTSSEKLADQIETDFKNIIKSFRLID